MNKGVWEEAVRENAYEKIVGPCDRCNRRTEVVGNFGNAVVSIPQS